MRTMKFNKKEIIDAAIGALIVETGPAILSNFVPPSFTTGASGTALAGAAAFVAGSMLKKPTIANVGLAVALAKIASNEIIDPIFASATAGLTAPPTLQNYTRLEDFPQRLRINKNYHALYN